MAIRILANASALLLRLTGKHLQGPNGLQIAKFILPAEWLRLSPCWKRWANAPLADGLFRKWVQCTPAGKFPTILPFWGSVLPIGFHFAYVNDLWRDWVIGPHMGTICTNRASANIYRPKHRMLTLVLRGEGWSQGDPSHLGRPVTSV